MEGMYNMRSPAVKRLMKEAQELRAPTEQYHAHPIEDNLFEWHFTIRGPLESEFDGGMYHGRIILPPEYPMKPPSIMILTPNGRFETNKKICLSISGHHPESWQPSWSIRTALLAIIGFMPTHGAGAIGSLNYTPEERKVLAKRSQDFKCPQCGNISGVLKPVTEASEKTRQEAKELAAQMDFKDEKEKDAALKEVRKHGGDTTPAPSGAEAAAAPGARAQAQAGVSEPLAIPPPFGQFPFQMPMMPGFLPPPPAVNSQTSVPRFPPPYIPHPFQQMMGHHAANYPRVVPPGMQVPPWPPGTMFPRPGGVPAQQPPAAASQPTVAPATPPAPPARDVGDANAAGTGASAGPAAAQNVSQSDSTTPSSETASVRQTTENQSQSSQTTPAASSTGVRQRTVTSPTTNQRRNLESVQVNNTRTSERESPAFLLFVAVISLVIALLIVRRLYMIKIFNKYWF